MNKKTLTIVVSAIAFVLALGVTLYPLISNSYNEKHASEIRTEYMEQIEQIDDSKIQEAKALALAYNDALKPISQSDESFSYDAIAEAADSYYEQLDVVGEGIMGYVDIPLIGVNLPIYHGTDSETLDIGIGHLLGSSLPVGGATSHCVLTAHSGVATQKLFSDLDKLSTGDVFYLHVLDETRAYQVVDIFTVLPHETDQLGIVNERDYCTLVTCTPFGVNTHRLLVRGERIPYEKAEEIIEEQEIIEEVESTWEEQYIKGIVIGLILILLLALIVGYITHRQNQGE